MNFDFTDDQRSFADSVDALLTNAAGSAALRKAWADGVSDESLWEDLLRIGVVGVMIEERLGGSGATAVDGALALERVGYHAVAAPVTENAFVLPLVLRDHIGGHSWLSCVASGEITITSVTEREGLAAYAVEAEGFLLIDNETVHLVPRDHVTIERVTASDPSLGLGKVVARTSEESAVATGREAVSCFRAAHAMSSALVLVGVAQRMLDMTCQYVLERRQFGHQIGSFQAVKHRLADAAVNVEAARSLAWYAAYASEYEKDQFHIASMCAKGAASNAASIVGDAALQLHGGIGFTWEHDLHLYLQRARSLEVLHGGPSLQRETVGRLFLDDVSSFIPDDSKARA